MDAGTNKYISNATSVANSLPYGSTYFHHPTGRYTDGRTIGDFLALTLGLPLPPPYLSNPRNISLFARGANFASAGSGLLPSTNNKTGLVPLKTQLQQLARLVLDYRHKVGEERTRDFLKESIFIFSTGTNDITGNYLMHPDKFPSEEVFLSLLVLAYENAIRSLYELGARKVIMLEVGPSGCTPRGRLAASRRENKTRGCLEAANELSKSFNSRLEGMFESLATDLHEAQLVLVKPFELMMSAIQNPDVYGFKSTTDACCGGGEYNAMVVCNGLFMRRRGGFLCPDPSEYLFWDAVHLTEHAYFMQFQNFWYSDGKDTVSPYNLQTLFKNYYVPDPPSLPE